MSLAQPIGGAGLHEPFARILPDRLEEAVPALAGDIALDTTRDLLTSLDNRSSTSLLVDAVASTHLLSGLERPRRPGTPTSG